MKYVNPDNPFSAGNLDDAQVSSYELESLLEALDERLREIGDDRPEERARVELERGRALLRLERGEEAWQVARAAFDGLVAAKAWEPAAECCEVLFLAEHDHEEQLAALGIGIWLSVTFPVNPDLTVALLQHVVDETEDDADGAAVAAATAHYVADLRTEGKARENLMFFTAQMLSTVAHRHSGIEKQEDFDSWMGRLELDEPGKFLVRLRNVVDVLVQQNWWIDREAIQAELPVN